MNVVLASQFEIRFEIIEIRVDWKFKNLENTKKAHDQNHKETYNCFTRWPKVTRRRNSNNLIGGEPKFVFWAFTQEAIAQRRMPSKMSTWQYFWRVLAPRVSPLDKSLDKNGNPNYG